MSNDVDVMTTRRFFNVIVLVKLLIVACILHTGNSWQKDIAVVVATLGRKNADDEEEDLSWIPLKLSSTKDLYVYQRTHPQRPLYIPTSEGNECLTYLTYIIENYHKLPRAVVFVHADAKRHCPFIKDFLLKDSQDIINLLRDEDRIIPGYLALSKVFLNQTKQSLEKFKYPLISFSNYVQREKLRYSRHVANAEDLASYECEPLPEDRPTSGKISDSEIINNNGVFDEYCSVHDTNVFPFVSEYPDYVTTYTSGSFIVLAENILAYPLQFYVLLQKHLHTSGVRGIIHGSRACGYMEYVWTTMWGGVPFQVEPDKDRSCGTLYYTDISPADGFVFLGSDDGSVESGLLPEGYHGKIRIRK